MGRLLQKRGLYTGHPAQKAGLYMGHLLQKHGMSMSIYAGHLALYMGHLLRNQVYIGATSHRSRSIYGPPCK